MTETSETGEEKKLSCRDFYETYHGHTLQNLERVYGHLKPQKEEIIWLAGDSSLDNKHWLFTSDKTRTASYFDPSYTAAAINGYETLLSPPQMVKDVAFWINLELQKRGDNNAACINTAIEESTLGNREFGTLRGQDRFIRDHISENDTLIVSVGGNDIALRPHPFTIFNILVLQRCIPHFLINCCFCSSVCQCTCVDYPCPACVSCLPCCCLGCPPGVGYFVDMFKNRVARYIKNLIGKKKPKRVVICMIYFLDETPGGSWADPVLGALGYNTNPSKLQDMIRRIFNAATDQIHIPGTEVIAYPLFQDLDGKSSEDYDSRVEPSVLGGRKMAKGLVEAVLGKDGEQPAGNSLN